MCNVGDDTTWLAGALGIAWLAFGPLPSPIPWAQLRGYALLVIATDTPIDRAITYLKDTGSPEHARGRLLLRAAERSLRESGDTGGEETHGK